MSTGRPRRNRDASVWKLSPPCCRYSQRCVALRVGAMFVLRYFAVSSRSPGGGMEPPRTATRTVLLLFFHRLHFTQFTCAPYLKMYVTA